MFLNISTYYLENIEIVNDIRKNNFDAVIATGNDVILALGVVNGMELNAGTMDTGAAWGDKNGYTLTFDGMEQSPMAMLEDYPTLTGPFTNAGFTNLNSIVTS